MRRELHHQTITRASEGTWTLAIAVTSTGPPTCWQAPPQGWAKCNSELRLQEKSKFLKKCVWGRQQAV